MGIPHIPVNERYYSGIEELLRSAKTDQQLFQAVVDAPFHDKSVTTMFGLGIVVLLLVDKKDKTIDRIALARTELAQGTLRMTTKPFEDIRIPLGNKENYIAIAIRSGQYMITSDWQYLFTPELSPEDARFNQAGGGIACSAVYPLGNVRDGGAIIFSYFETIEKIGEEHHKFMKSFTQIAAKALAKRRG